MSMHSSSSEAAAGKTAKKTDHSTIAITTNFFFERKGLPTEHSLIFIFFSFSPPKSFHKGNRE
jgi:hypothetical protein